MIKDLNVNEIIKFGRRVWEIDKYLPKLDKKPPLRQWFCTVGNLCISFICLVNTLAHEEFKKFIKSRLEKREKEIVMMKNIHVNAAPEFVELFRNSKLRSSMFALLLCYLSSCFKTCIACFNSSLISLNICWLWIDQNGRFHHFLRSNRKRTYAEIEEKKDEELKELEEEKLKLQDQILDLANEVDFLKKKKHGDLIQG